MVDVFVRYPANSVVDMNAVTSRLVRNGTTQFIVTNGGDQGGDTKTGRSVTEVLSEQFFGYQAENPFH